MNLWLILISFNAEQRQVQSKTTLNSSSARHCCHHQRVLSFKAISFKSKSWRIFIKGQTNDRNRVCIITFRSVSPGQWRSTREPGGEQDQDTGIIFFFSTSLTYRAHHHPFQSLLSGSMKKEIVVSQYSRVESLVENNFRTQVLYSCFLHTGCFF